LKYFIVMEYMSGGDLYTLLERKSKLKESEVRRLGQQIVAGLTHCYNLRVSHRDIKLENLLLDSSNNVKLGDFGFARVCNDGDFCRTMCGTPNYTAPELIANQDYDGAASDIWSLGVVLYALLVGKLPFDDVNLSSLFAKASRGRYMEPRHVSSTVRGLIRQMLDPNPVTRITYAELQVHPWFTKKLPYYIQHHLVLSHEIDHSLVEKCSALKYFHSRAEDLSLITQVIKKDGSFYVTYEILKTEQDRLLITEACGQGKTQDQTPAKDKPAACADKRRSGETPHDWSYGLPASYEQLRLVGPAVQSLGMRGKRTGANKICLESETHQVESAIYTTESSNVVDFKYTGGSIMHFLDQASTIAMSTLRG
jgi:serine/threonine protein kinase